MTPERLAQAGYGITLLILPALIVFLGWSARTRAFDPDEFQHLQMAWLVAIGEVPYRDFFEHHTPLYHFAIAPFLGDPALTTDGTAAIRTLIALRMAGVALCFFILVQTEWIARAISGRLGARCAALILATSVIFALKGLEIRPDQLAACLMLGATLFLLGAERARNPLWLLAGSGAAAMLAILTTQKLVFAMPGLAATFLAIAFRRQLTAMQSVRAALAVIGGATLAALPLLAWFSHHDALGMFFTDNFLLGAHWPRDSRQLVLTLSAMLRDETLMILLSALGIVAVFARGWRSAIWPLAIVAPMISMVALMSLFPVVQPQYLFLWLPYAAILGGIGAAFTVDRLGTTPALRAATASLIVGSIALHGVLVIKTQSTAYETEAFDKLRYTVEQTPPDSKILRAWSPGMAFRRPAFFYFSLNPEIRAVVPSRDWVALEAGLRNGSIAPDLIEMDDAMRAMPPGIVQALEDGWAPTGPGDIWRRKAR